MAEAPIDSIDISRLFSPPTLNEMNKRSIVIAVASAALALVICATLLHADSPKGNSATATATPASNDQQKQILQNFVGGIMESLKTRGWTAIPSLKVALQNAVKSEDKGTILRAFNDAIYSAQWDMDEVVPALQTYLKDPDPYVRYLAAQSLFTVGDESGYQTLLDLVKSDVPIEGLGKDVRIAAAETLAQFRQADAIQSIYHLYQETKNGNLIVALQKVAPDKVGALIPPDRFYRDPFAVRDYGIEGDRQFEAQIRDVFESSQHQDLKTAAAWALASMTGDKAAINYLIQTAQTSIPASGTSQRDALRYLGSIQTPEARQALVAALNSSDSTMKEIAMVNLLFNQGGSEEAINAVAQQLDGMVPPGHEMAWDLIFNIAVQLRDNPTIAAAGEKYAARQRDGTWRRFVEQRANWPIYNWIDNYVVKLNKQP